MKADQPLGLPGQPASCRGRVRERARFQWSIGDPGDPADLVEAYMTDLGLPGHDLRPATHSHHGQALCGAAVLLSADACALLGGGTRGAATPAPAVPDVVVAAYEHDASRPAADTGAGADWWVGDWRPGWSPAAHAAGAATVREGIARGEVYQVNVVGHWSAPYEGDARQALARLAALPGARYAGVLSGDGWAVGCASPESFLEVRGDLLVTRPIKGTRPATAAGRAELLASPKERAEHVMIVDLERNDLARVARTGSVRVDELYAIRRWCDLWQAESTVSARAVSGLGLAGLLRAMCPGGSVTGAPKLAALDTIAAVEPIGRGPSMGALGFVRAGHVDLGLTIRTAAADADSLHVWAGGGITWSSDPAAEVAEAEAKAAPLRAALGTNPRSGPRPVRAPTPVRGVPTRRAAPASPRPAGP